MKKKLIYILISIFVLITSVWIFRFPITIFLLKIQGGDPKTIFLSINMDEEINKYLSKIEDDYSKIKDVEIFNQPSNGLSDAGSILNPLFRIDPLIKSDSNYELRLSDKSKSILKEFNNAQRTKLDWTQIGLDFSWFKNLQNFDHWNFYGDLDSGVGKNRNFYSLPFPRSFNLADWSRLRLLKGADEGDLNSAIKDVRQLVKLMLTAEDPILTNLAIMILTSETKFRKIINAKNIMPPEIKEDVLNSAKRFFWAQPSFTDLRVSDDLFNKLANFKTGLCQRLNVTMISQKAFKNSIYVDMPTKFDRIDKLINETDQECRQSYIRKKWNDPNYVALSTTYQNVFDNTKEPSFFQISTKDLGQNKKLDNIISYILINISQPNYLNLYYKNQ